MHRFAFIITPILYIVHTTSFYQLHKKKKKKKKKYSLIGSVRHSLGFEFLNLMISPHCHRNGGQSPNADLSSFGRRYNRDGVVGAGRLGRLR